MTTDLFPVSLDEMIAEVERELSLREHVYPKWIEAKKMRPEKADQCVARMRAVLQTLKSLKEKA